MRNEMGEQGREQRSIAPILKAERAQNLDEGIMG